jgi:hypothetical protein
MANRQNPNAPSGLTNREKWSLEAKARTGWKCYYIEREWAYHLQDIREPQRVLVANMRTGSAEPTYEHLKNMFLELYDKVGELTDCPVCLEAMTKEKTTVPNCGHLICKDCRPLVECCPICRKNY